MVQRSGTIPNRFFELTQFLSSPFSPTAEIAVLGAEREARDPMAGLKETAERKESPIDDRVEERADSSDKPRRRGQSQARKRKARSGFLACSLLISGRGRYRMNVLA